MLLRPVRLVVFLAAALALVLSHAAAQITSQTGAVRVFVLDPQAGSVSAAKVSISSQLGLNLSKETESDGSVTFPLLEPGTYTVVVEHAGFRRLRLGGVVVKITEV